MTNDQNETTQQSPAIELLRVAESILLIIAKDVQANVPHTTQTMVTILQWSVALRHYLDVHARQQGKVFSLGVSDTTGDVMISIGEDVALFAPDKAKELAVAILKLSCGVNPVAGDDLISDIGLNAALTMTSRKQQH